jgi:EmrB/QacA subfamily drug resistance transporter
MHQLTSKKKMAVMIALMATMFFAAINQTIISAALPKIIAQLGGMTYYSWVITIYMLTSTISTIVFGKLSDIYGRKKFLLIGISFFLAGSFLTGLSANIFQMIAFRGIQGIGGGMLMTITLTAIGDLYPPDERAKWTGTMMAIFGLSSILGPVLGGAMVDCVAWKWLFWIFIPVGAIAFAMIWKLFPKVAGKRGESIDYLGSVFLAITIAGLILGFSWAGTKFAWGSLQIIGLFAATLLAIVLLVLVERKAKNPIMPLSLFKNKGVTISNTASFMMSGGMMGAMSFIPFYIQGVKGMSATQSGLLNIPMSIMMIIFSALSGRWLSKRCNYRLFAVIGLGAMSGSMLIMANMNHVAWTAVSLIIFGVGLGFSMTVFTTAAQNSAPPSQLGVVTATCTLFRNLGGTIFIAVFGSIMNTSLASNLQKAMAAGKSIDFTQLDGATAETFQTMANAQLLLDQNKLDTLRASLPDQFSHLFTNMVDMVRTAMGQALSWVFYIGAFLLFVGVVLSLFLKVKPGGVAESKLEDDAEKILEK